MNQCKCGQLEKWAADPNIPISFDKRAHVFSLNVTPVIKVELVFCPFCGGSSPKRGDVPQCQCNEIANWARMPESCVLHDSKQDEYHLVYGDRCRLFFYYCPQCGGRLPETKIGQCFEKPSEAERLKFVRKLQKMRTLSEVIQTLGEPDERYVDVNPSNEEKEIYGVMGIKTSIYYTRIARTLNVVAQELEDGTLQIIYTAKEKHAA